MSGYEKPNEKLQTFHRPQDQPSAVLARRVLRNETAVSLAGGASTMAAFRRGDLSATTPEDDLPRMKKSASPSDYRAALLKRLNETPGAADLARHPQIGDALRLAKQRADAKGRPFKGNDLAHAFAALRRRGR